MIPGGFKEIADRAQASEVDHPASLVEFLAADGAQDQVIETELQMWPSQFGVTWRFD